MADSRTLRDIELRRERWKKPPQQQQQKPRESRAPVHVPVAAAESKSAERIEPQRSRQHDSVNAHVESYLSSQLMSHTCPLCCELMRGDARAPIIVFGCGHTLCRACLDKFCGPQASPAQPPCPVCGAPVQSHAVNQSLQQLIEAFLVSQTSLVHRKQQQHMQQSNHQQTCFVVRADPQPVALYADQLSMLETRMSVMRTQRARARDDAARLSARAAAFRDAQAALAAEEAHARAAVDAAQQQLELVRAHLAEQRDKQQAAQRAAEDAAQRAGLADASLAELKLQREKVAILLRGAGHEPCGALEGKSAR